jgi:hypothetical protein
MRSLFASKEVLRELVEKMGAIEGGKQTLDRCAAYIAGQLKS